MKQTPFRYVLLLGMIGLAACSGRGVDQAVGTQNSSDDYQLKICVLGSGTVDVKDWTFDVYETLQGAENDLGAEIIYVEAADSPKDFQKEVHAFSSLGCAIVVGQGSQFEEAAITVGNAYPETFFLVVDSRAYHSANVIGISVDSRQGFYLLGMMAAEMGSRAGLVGGAEILPVTEAFAGFVDGAQAVSPEFPVSEIYLDDWADVAGAKQTALDMLAGGADFVVPYAGIAGVGVYHAVVEENLWTFGVMGDQHDQAPKNIVASFMVDYGQGVANIMSEIKAGVFKPTGNIVFDLADEDVVFITYNEGSDYYVPQELRDEVEQVRVKFAVGEIE